MRLSRKVAAGGLFAVGGGSYTAYELSDTISPLSYSLDVPVMPSLAIAEDASPSVEILFQENPNAVDSGIQLSDSNSKSVMSSNPSSKLPESTDPKPEKDENKFTDAERTTDPVKKPTEEGQAEVVKTNSKNGDTIEKPVVSPSNPDEQPTTVPKEAGPSVPNPASPEEERQNQKLQLQTKHKENASSYGLQVVNDYEAHSLDNFNGDPNSTTKVQTFVMGEDADYVKDLWTSSIAVKHRKYWNLAPDEDPIWDKQLAHAQKRFYHHAHGHKNSKTMYAWVFGNFTMDKNQVDNYQRIMRSKKGDINSYRERPYMPLLNKFNLARTCKQNLARTPWGTWWSGARDRYWILLWDFCAKPEHHEREIPTNIDYWYREWTGPRKQSEFNHVYPD